MPELDSSLTFCPISHLHYDELYLNFQMRQEKKKKRLREFGIVQQTRRLFWSERPLVALAIKHTVP